MPVSASKLVTLAQLQAQAERVKQELAKYTPASELGSLAKKSEISEADLSAALKSVIDGKMDAADSMTTEAINSAIATAIAKSAHARFEKVEKVPSNDEAQDNVLYLVMNAATGYYDIYAKVGEEVVRLDDTTVDLSNYATIEQLNAVSKKHSHANAAELDKIATGDKAKWDATSTKVEGIAEGATKVEASTTEGNIKINGVETAVVTIATDTEVTEMLTEVFGATA